MKAGELIRNPGNKEARNETKTELIPGFLTSWVPNKFPSLLAFISVY
jgi:hypothetical protein